MSKEINNSDFGESNHFDLKDINRIIEGKYKLNKDYY